MNTTQKNAYILDLSIVFLIAFLPRLLMILIGASPLRTPLDEMSTFATGAYAAGFDWSSVAAYGEHYYGGGYAILFAPLFKIVSNPYTFYKITLIVSAVLQSLIGIIAYRIAHKYLKMENRLLCIFIGIALSYMQIIRVLMFYNEHMLMLMVWVSILLLCRLTANSSDSRRRAIDSTLLMLVLSYCLTLHTRSKALWIALFIIIVLFRIFYKRMLVSVIPTLVAGGVGYFAANCFIRFSMIKVWLWSEGSKLTNSSVNLNLSWDLLKSPQAWEGWLSTVLSQIHISIIFTGGLTAILLPVFFYYLGDSFKHFRTHSNHCADADVRPFILVISLFSGLFIGAMIFAQSFTWLPRIVSALNTQPYGGNPYGYKAFTYIRYYVICLGPFVLSGLAILYHHSEMLPKLTAKIITFFFSMQTIFVGFILPHITNAAVASSVYIPFAFSTGRGLTNAKVYLAGVFICCLLFPIMLICFHKKKRLMALFLLCLLMAYEYGFNGMNTDLARSAANDSRTNAGYEMLRSLSASSPDFPDTIYTDSISARIYVYQFLLPDIKLVPALPDPSCPEAIVLALKKDSSLTAEGYQMIKLDRNEYLYVKGTSYLKMIEAAMVDSP